MCDWCYVCDYARFCPQHEYWSTFMALCLMYKALTCHASLTAFISFSLNTHHWGALDLWDAGSLVEIWLLLVALSQIFVVVVEFTLPQMWFLFPACALLFPYWIEWVLLMWADPLWMYSQQIQALNAALWQPSTGSQTIREDKIKVPSIKHSSALREELWCLLRHIIHAPKTCKRAP